MRQNEVSKWLKGISIIMGLMGLLFFVFLMPALVKKMTEIYPEGNTLYILGMCYGWLIAVISYVVLFQFWKVCTQIGKDNSFSRENARSFVVISRLGLVLALLWFAGILYLEWAVWLELGKLVFMLGAVLLNMILSILAAALSHLILKAYELKQENELTI